MGLLADLAFGGLLGEQALRLTVMAFILQRFRARCASSRCRSRRWRSAACCSTIAWSAPRVHFALGEPQLPWSFWWAPLLGMLLWAPLFLLLDALRAAGAGAERRWSAAAASSRMPAPKRRSSARARRSASLLVVLALGGLALWYFQLQVIQHDDYATRSEANRIKPRPVVPGRGLILRPQGPRARRQRAGLPARRDARAGRRHSRAARASCRRSSRSTPRTSQHFDADRKATRGFRPVTLKLRISDEEAARFAVDRWRYPGVDLVPYLSRRYPYGALFAHVIGYVGRIDEADLAKLGDTSTAFTHTGKTGLERYYEDALRGAHRLRAGRDQRRRPRAAHASAACRRRPARTCSCRSTWTCSAPRCTAFGDFDGSAVAVDPRTGEILAMVSLPSFDPNLFVNGISHDDYRALMDNPSRPLFNRNVLGGGAAGFDDQAASSAWPGSTAACAGPRTRCSRPASSTSPASAAAIATRTAAPAGPTCASRSPQSVNYYYYKLAYDMGIAALRPVDAQVRIRRADRHRPARREPAASCRRRNGRPKHSKEPWYVGETVIAGIGQGYWKVTLLQLARGVAALADDGLRHRLHLVRARRDGYNAPWMPLPQPRAGAHQRQPRSTCASVAEGMMQTMQPGGTGAAVARGAPYLIAGKTGTAQNDQPQGQRQRQSALRCRCRLRHQALVHRAIAPVDDPKIAVAVDGRARRLRREHRRRRSRARSWTRGCWARCRSRSRRDRRGGSTASPASARRDDRGRADDATTPVRRRTRRHRRRQRRRRSRRDERDPALAARHRSRACCARSTGRCACALLALMAIGLAVLYSAGDESPHLVHGAGRALRARLRARCGALSRVPPNRLRHWTPLRLWRSRWCRCCSCLRSGRASTATSGSTSACSTSSRPKLLKLSLPMMVAWYLNREILPPRFRVVLVAARASSACRSG